MPQGNNPKGVNQYDRQGMARRLEEAKSRVQTAVSGALATTRNTARQIKTKATTEVRRGSYKLKTAVQETRQDLVNASQKHQIKRNKLAIMTKAEGMRKYGRTSANKADFKKLKSQDRREERRQMGIRAIDAVTETAGNVSHGLKSIPQRVARVKNQMSMLPESQGIHPQGHSAKMERLNKSYKHVLTAGNRASDTFIKEIIGHASKSAMEDYDKEVRNSPVLTQEVLKHQLTANADLKAYDDARKAYDRTLAERRKLRGRGQRDR